MLFVPFWQAFPACLFFSVSAATGTIKQTVLIGDIPSGRHAVLNAEVDFSGEGSVEIVYGSVTVLTIKADSLIFGDIHTAGKFGKGVYKIEATIAPEQKMLIAKVTSPDGSIVTRGFNTLLGSGNVNFYVEGESGINSANYYLDDAKLNSYKSNDTEPAYTGVAANIYNLVTSFDIAQTTRNFAWTAKADFLNGSEMQLKYRKVGDAEWTTVPAIKETETVETADEDYFKCDLTSLTPDTEYEYKVGKADGDEETEWLNSFTFKTAAENVDDFTFLAISDTQGQDSWYYHKSTLTVMQEALEEVENPAFILHAGDIVDNELKTADWNRFFKAMNNSVASIPFFATVGNHDCWNTDPSKTPFYFDLHFNHPNNGGSAAYNNTYMSQIKNNVASSMFSEYGDETVYSFNYGDVHVAVINTGGYNGTYNKTNLELLALAQKNWLIKDLRANKDAKWTIVLQHANTHCFLGGDYHNDWLADVLEDEQYGVDLVLQGDTHNVVRSYPMRDGKIVTKAVDNTIKTGLGTIYATLGVIKPSPSKRIPYNGYEGLTFDETSAVVATSAIFLPTYTTVNVTGDKLTVTTKQVDGLVVDRFTIADNPDLGGADDGEDKPPFVGDTFNPTSILAIIFASVIALAVTAIMIFKKKLI